MTDEDRTEQDDLESQDGQPLPDREVMSIITPEPQPLPASEADEQGPLRGGEPL